jgi:hypothetical protein
MRDIYTSQRISDIFGFYQLLSTIYQKLLSHRQTASEFNQEGAPFRVK